MAVTLEVDNTIGGATVGGMERAHKVRLAHPPSERFGVHGGDAYSASNDCCSVAPAPGMRFARYPSIALRVGTGRAGPPPAPGTRSKPHGVRICVGSHADSAPLIISSKRSRGKTHQRIAGFI